METIDPRAWQNLIAGARTTQFMYTPNLRYRGCYVTDVFAYLVISSVLRALAVFYIRDPTTQTITPSLRPFLEDMSR